MEQPTYKPNFDNNSKFNAKTVYNSENLNFRPTYEWCVEQFKRINELIFLNKLEIPKFKFVRTKSFSGMFCGLLNDKNKIKLSLYRQRTEFEFINILVHEMLHQWIFESGTKDTSSHGYWFKHYMYQINSTYGFNLSISTMVQKEIKTGKTAKQIYVILFQYDNEDCFQIISDNKIEMFMFQHRFLKHNPKLYVSHDAFFTNLRKCRERIIFYKTSRYAQSLEEFISKYSLISLEL